MLNKMFIFTVLAILTRILPHPPNASAFCAMALYSGWKFKPKTAYLSLLTAYFISNWIMAFYYHLPYWGSWLLFTTSGLIAIIFIASKWDKILIGRQLYSRVILMSLFYWAWTNLGVWIGGDFYAKTPEGLWQCYIMGLPFLGYSLLGDLFWTFVLLGLPFLKKRVNPAIIYQ